ncbi:hypothetical protein EU523_00490 [Candidatus Heimdallarchaeota archaeon]|jgi:hypothetical protein|nr:MAG: hypothetical protein EU523_00490 [Candidatus Heimdallarchaeota archaeon]
MGYEMTRPTQKWLGFALVASCFVLMLFTFAVPYINHFTGGKYQYTYFTKWNGRWRSDLLPANTFGKPSELHNFPISASVFIGLGMFIAFAGGIYAFYLTYSNKSCFFTRKRPGPVPGAAVFAGCVLYLIGSLIYERWAFGSPRPAEGWPGDPKFSPTMVRLSPTFWISLVIAFIAMAFSVWSVVFHFEIEAKKPVT